MCTMHAFDCCGTLTMQSMQHCWLACLVPCTRKWHEASGHSAHLHALPIVHLIVFVESNCQGLIRPGQATHFVQEAANPVVAACLLVLPWYHQPLLIVKCIWRLPSTEPPVMLGAQVGSEHTSNSFCLDF